MFEISGIQGKWKTSLSYWKFELSGVRVIGIPLYLHNDKVRHTSHPHLLFSSTLTIITPSSRCEVPYAWHWYLSWPFFKTQILYCIRLLFQVKDEPSEALEKVYNAVNKDKSLLNRAPGSPVTSKITLTKSDLTKLDKGFLSAKQKLEYVARSEGFQVIYNDFVNKVGQPY